MCARFYFRIKNNKVKLAIIFILNSLFIVLFLPLGRNIIAKYYIDRSNKYFSESNIISSVEYFRKAKRINPCHPEILFLEYKAAKANKDESKAYLLLEKSVSTGYDNIDVWYDLARFHSKHGKHKKEIELYQRILEIDKNHPEANYCLAMHYDKVLHERDKAIYHLRIARDNLPTGNIWRQRCEEILNQLKKNEK